MTICWKDLFCRFIIRAFRERLSICVPASVRFGIKGGIRYLIVLVSVLGRVVPFTVRVYR